MFRWNFSERNGDLESDKYCEVKRGGWRTAKGFEFQQHAIRESGNGGILWEFFSFFVLIWKCELWDDCVFCILYSVLWNKNLYFGALVLFIIFIFSKLSIIIFLFYFYFSFGWLLESKVIFLMFALWSHYFGLDLWGISKIFILIFLYFELWFILIIVL